LQAYADLSPLYSFPTRRSSDLVSGSSTRFACLPQPCQPRLSLSAVTMLTTLLRSLKNQQNLCHQPSLSSHPRPLSALRLPSRSRDRKSTRLNSSHVSISYAVFC